MLLIYTFHVVLVEIRIYATGVSVHFFRKISTFLRDCVSIHIVAITHLNLIHLLALNLLGFFTSDCNYNQDKNLYIDID